MTKKGILSTGQAQDLDLKERTFIDVQKQLFTSLHSLSASVMSNLSDYQSLSLALCSTWYDFLALGVSSGLTPLTLSLLILISPTVLSNRVRVVEYLPWVLAMTSLNDDLPRDDLPDVLKKKTSTLACL